MWRFVSALSGPWRWLHRLRGAFAVRVAVAGLAASSAVAGVAVPLAAAAATPQRVLINAKSAVVLDVDSGRILYAKQPDRLTYPASTTKLMTAILLVNYLNPDDPVYVSPAASRQPRVRLGLKPGTTITAEEALHALLMKSSNDVAYAIAESVGGSQAGFARMMNMKARLIGCRHTRFVTPNGLHDDDHRSTAHDIALILAEATKYPRIVAALQTKNYTVAGKSIHNANRMIYGTSGSYGQVVGGKTGYTSKAMFCLAFAVRQHGRLRVSVVLGAPTRTAMYGETRRLLTYAEEGRSVQLV